MPRPTPDRVIHDCTFVTLPLAMVFVLLIFTVLALVYSIGVKTPIPEDLAIAFAGLVCGLFGLWMVGHLVRYCRGHYTRGGVAEAMTPPPLPLANIATGIGGTTMAVPLASQAAGASIALPTSYQQPQQQRQHTRQYQPQQRQEQHQQQQRSQEHSPRPRVQPQPPPQSRFQHQQRPQSEQQQPQQQQRHHQRQDQKPLSPPENAWGPNDPKNASLNHVPTILRPGPKQRQQPSDPNPRTGHKPLSVQRKSSVQRTPVEAYTGHHGHSLDGPRPLHRESRQVSRESHLSRVTGGAPSDDVAGLHDGDRHPPAEHSRLTLQQGDAEQEPRRASIQPANLDSGTWNSPQLATLTIAPLRIRKGVDQSQAPSFEEPYPNAWIPTNQRLQGDQQAGQTKPNLHGPRPQPQSDRRANESHAIRVVSESPPRNNAISVQPAQAEVLDHYPAPVPAPPPPSLPARRFEDIDHPGVQRASQTSNVFRATADEIRKYVSGEKINTDPATNFVLLPRYIFTHSQVVDLERGNAKLFEVSFKETDGEKSSRPRGGFQYKYDGGIIVEDPNEERRSSTPSSCWSSWSSRSGTPPTSIRLE